MKLHRYGALFCLTLSLAASCKPGEPKPRVNNTDEKNVDRSQNAQNKAVRIAFNEDAPTFDPRKARSLNSITVIRCIYEGLTRTDKDGTIQPAIATNFLVSPDLKTYTFALRDCNWSNGKPVTAHDFEYAWKTSLDPEFHAPNAYQLFVIENAKAAFDGKVSRDAIGVRALDDKTLEVKLENPAPYFLQLLDFHCFFPVCKESASLTQDGANNAHLLVTNGPFSIKESKPTFEITLKKNNRYWDAEHVKLEAITLPILDETTAFNMFEGGELDWIGSPNSIIPPDAIATCKKQGTLQVAPSAGTQIIRANTEAALFTNEKMRQAFSYAIDRQGICQHIMQGGHTPAKSFVPPCMHLSKENYLQDATVVKAQSLFRSALAELGQTKEALPVPTLSYVTCERNQIIAQALQKNWKNAFDIEIALDPCESKIFYEKISKKNYQLAIGSWIADFNDPINFLTVFQYKNNGTNNTNWENSEYVKLLNESSNESDEKKRFEKLAAAEAILMKEAPIFPVYHYVYNYVKNDRLQNATLSPLGSLDLKNAYVTEE